MSSSEHPPAAAPPVPTLDKRSERPHPASPLIRGWVVLVVILFAVGRELIPGEGEPGLFGLLERNLLLALGGLIVVLVIVAATSFVTWWFTQYVIDDDELRIETGLFTKTSKRIPFGRIQSIDVIQPLAARIFGLAELKIDAGNDTTSLRYLTNRRAHQLREFLSARAAGEHALANQPATPAGGVPAEAAVAPTPMTLGSSSTAERPGEQVLVKIPMSRLILGFIASTEFVIWMIICLVLIAIGLGAMSWTSGFSIFSLAVIAPIALGVIRSINTRLLSQANYTLLRTDRGLRVSRGLTSLSSRSLPIDRIQGIRISQPLLWRRLGFHAIDINVLGVARDSEDSGQGDQSSSILLPVGNDHDLNVVLSVLLPGVNLGTIRRWPISPRGRLFHWFTNQTYHFGHDDQVAISTHGLLTRIAEVIPHSKVQSIRITQGVLQRLARTATVHLDNTPGPVSWTASDLDPVAARAFAFSQIDRSEAARRQLQSDHG